MSHRRVVGVVALGLVFGSAERSAEAGLVTWEFGGEINRVMGLGDAVTVGMPFSGSFTFESTTPDSDADRATRGIYDNAVTAISGQIGDLLFFESDTFSSAIGVRDFPAGGDNDSFTLGVSNITILGFAGSFRFGFGVYDADGSSFDNDSLPLWPPDVASSIHTSATFRAVGSGVGAGAFGDVQVLVPEPGSLALLAFAASTLLKRRRKPPCDAVDTKHRPR